VNSFYCKWTPIILVEANQSRGVFVQASPPGGSRMGVWIRLRHGMVENSNLMMESRMHLNAQRPARRAKAAFMRNEMMVFP
jgi:hypothetical protein